jgi:hypothetical protein
MQGRKNLIVGLQIEKVSGCAILRALCAAVQPSVHRAVQLFAHLSSGVRSFFGLFTAIASL